MHGKQLARYALCVFLPLITTSMAANLSIAATPSVIPIQKPITTKSVTASTNSAQLWNLKNADIRAVIQAISILTGKNFVIDPRVQGNITLVSQKPMTPDEMRSEEHTSE